MAVDDAQQLLALFGLREHPFAPTADPAYFYATREHKECLFRIWNSIDSRHGIAVVLGNYGTGKTTLLRKLMTGMAADPERYNTAIIGSPIPSWTTFALLESINTQFKLRARERSFVSYMEALNHSLLDNRHRISTIIIDDAQNLNKRGQLELLRLVQNLETPQHKLLNLVMFAQLEWTQVLKAAPNFEQRINTTYTLSDLKLEETQRFIEFRLARASVGADREAIFTDGSIRTIHAYGSGNPRVTVTLCRNALVVAARLRKTRITEDIILHTIEKSTVPDTGKRTAVASMLVEQTREPRVTAGEGHSRAVTVKRAHDARASRILMKAAEAREKANP